MPKRILVVDDEPSIRFVFSALLEREGYTVDVAEDGFVALRKVRKAKPDLVITDLRMPNMNGFELLSVLRTKFPELPTIAISGEFITLDTGEGPLADAFFEKGHYATPALLERVAALLRSKPERPHPSEAPVWSPTGDEPVMLTCTNCLRSFPIPACEGSTPPKETSCIFCSEHLTVQMYALGMARCSNV